MTNVVEEEGGGIHPNENNTKDKAERPMSLGGGEGIYHSSSLTASYGAQAKPCILLSLLTCNVDWAGKNTKKT